MKKTVLSLVLILGLLAAKAQTTLVFFRDVPPSHAQYIAARIVQVVPVYTGDSIQAIFVTDMPEAYCSVYKAYDATKFLDKLGITEKRIISITYRDLVYGCRPFGLHGLTIYHTSIVSLYGLGTVERVTKIAIHELGHTYGLEHCKTPGCLMQAGTTKGTMEQALNNIDNLNDFCPVCKLKLKMYKFRKYEK